MTPEETEHMIALLEAPPVAPGHLGQALLLRLAAAELAGPEGAEIEAHVAGCPHCAARLAMLEAERRAFLVRRPASAFLAALEDRRAAAPPWWRRWLPAVSGGLLLAAAALAVFGLRAPEPEPLAAAGAPATRIKSSVGLSFHVRTPDGVRAGAPGEVYHAGDAIQLRYSSATYRHLVVVSLDGRGAVTPFYDDDGRSLAIEPGVGKLLEGSVILDDAVGTERVIGCFSQAPLRTDAVVAAAEAALAEADGDSAAVARLALDCAQATFTLEKRSP